MFTKTNISFALLLAGYLLVAVALSSPVAESVNATDLSASFSLSNESLPPPESSADNTDTIELTKAVKQTGTSVTAPSVPGKRFALLISVNEYNQLDGLSTLKYCDNDMEGLERALEEFEYDKIVRMHAKATETALHVNRTNVKVQLKSILDKATGENDTLIIAFSGHGVQEDDSRYLCPPNTPKKYDPGDLIPLYASENAAADHAFGILNIIENRFREGSFHGTCYLFIDACRNGDVSSRATVFPKHGRIHLFSSCAANQVSYEEDRFANGRFMHFVIQAFNIERGTELDFGALTSQVERQMRAFNPNQIPALHATQYERSGPLLLGRKQTPVYTLQKNRAESSIVMSSRSAPIDMPGAIPYTSRKPISDPIFPEWPDFSGKDPEEQKIIMDMIQLPGLNGEWWFQEMPWYLPAARFALARILSAESASPDDPRRFGKNFLGNNIEAYLNTNTSKTRELIWSYLSRDECRALISADEFEIMREMRKKSSYAGNVRDLQDLQYKKLKTFLDQLRKNRRGKLNEIDLYTFAVLEHQLALLSPSVTKKADTNQAEESYRIALNALKEIASTHDSANLFYQLCLADYTRFLATLFANPQKYEEAFKQLTDSLRFGYKTSLFQIALFIDNAVNESSFGRLQEAARGFREAGLRILESKILNTGHPIIAYYNEQYGWYQIDYWRLKPARENFETALLIRQYNAWSSSDPIDMMYVTYGQHAMGTISRFSGNNEKAREYLEEARDFIKKIRSEMPKDSLSLSSNRLDEREASTLERLADLTLYGESVSVSELSKAVEHYASGASRTNKISTTRPKLLAKQALLCLKYPVGMKGPDGFDKNEQARKCLQKAALDVVRSLENPSANTVVPVLFFQAASIAVDLVEATEAKDMERFETTRRKMYEFLERFMLFSQHQEGQKRDAMELRLHCASLLLESDLKLNRLDFAARDTLYLSVCLYNLSAKEGIHAFLRPYYERQLGMRFSILEPKPEDIQALAMGIQRMRSVTDSTETTPTTILPSLLTKGSQGPDTKHEDASRGSDQWPVVSGQSQGFDPLSENGEGVVERGLVSVPIYNPTKHPLVDSVTLVIFHFPELIGANGVRENGFVLLVPSGSRAKEFIRLPITRDQLFLQAQTGELGVILQETWQRIEQEAERLSPVFSGVQGQMRQSVVVSWSDESCWPKDSSHAVTVDMFPFKNIPDNILIQ